MVTKSKNQKRLEETTQEFVIPSGCHTTGDVKGICHWNTTCSTQILFSISQSP